MTLAPPDWELVNCHKNASRVKDVDKDLFDANNICECCQNPSKDAVKSIGLWAGGK